MWKKAIAIGLLLTGSVAFAAAGSAEEVSRGRDLAERRCASCHAIGETNASPNRLAPPFRSLYRLYPVDALQPAFLTGLEVDQIGRASCRERVYQEVSILVVAVALKKKKYPE